MVGNDLVDLKQAKLDSNWQRKGYLTKLYTKEEQSIILNAAVPSSMLWLLWTMKEASYKIINRLTGIRDYSPLSFTCTNLLIKDNLQATGCVIFNQYKFITHSEINDQLIHSAAGFSDKDFKDMNLCYMENTPDYMEQFNNSYPSWDLKRSVTGLPEMTCLYTGKRHAISISHHGKYLAIIYSDSLLLAD